MKSTEEMSDETARDLLGMMFDEGGVSVPPDDLAPAAMAEYQHYRRWRTALIGAAASVALVATTSVALVVSGGGSGRSDDTPGGSTGTTATAPLKQQGSPTVNQAVTSAQGSSGSSLVDCFSNFEADAGSGKAQADCRRAEQLWRTVFPGMTVSGARNPSFAQITNGFLARVGVQKASAPSLYGRAQPQVVQDWVQARQENANAGDQSWSGFNIATAQGAITVSADFRSSKNADTHQQCLGSTPCESVPLSDSSVAEVSGTGDIHGYTVTVRSQTGDAYRITFSSHYDPRYVAVTCSAPGGRCYADLTDGAIRPGAVPDSTATIGTPVVTHAVLMDILRRPAFATLAQEYFAGGLGQPGSVS
jgi:hypothetical protein